MWNFNIETRNNGDLYLITGTDEKSLAKLWVDIFRNFGEPVFNEDKNIKELIEWKEYRPNWCFSIKLEKNWIQKNRERKSTLIVDNRNWRWIKQFTDELKKAIEGVDEIKEVLTSLKKSI